MTGQLLAPGGALARAMPDYEDRPGQRAMAEEVAAALDDERSLLVEAGTGTGKTLAYLLPAALSGKRVVVSTGTRTLQEQLAHKDIPLLERILGRPVDAAQLKGISNYLCRRRFAEVMAVGVPAEQEQDWDAVRAWVGATETGDRAEVAGVSDAAAIWSVLTTTAETRAGPRCPHYERCFVTRARRRAETADIILVNHHLFFADLALRTRFPGAHVLPEYDAVIFDEAHQLEEVITEHFGITASTLALAQMARDTRIRLRAGPLPLLDAGALPDAERLARHLERCAAALFARLRLKLAPLISKEATRVELPSGLVAGAAERDAYLALDTALEEIETHAALRAETLRGDDDDGAEECAALSRRMGGARAALATILESSGRDLVYWGRMRGRSVFLGASPADVSGIVRDHVLASVGAAVFTSATLRAAKSFDYIRHRLGISEDVASGAAFESPFDYGRQAILYVPRDLPEPAQAEFLAAACGRIEELVGITGGRAFVLFTSHRALTGAGAILRDRLPHPVFTQGEQPRASLLAAFRATPGAVLLATGSFWEGVDVPGDALSLVILDKLPFSPPTDPMTRARMRRIEESGGDPFTDYQLPQAALALKQGFGRLIRRRDDRGIVAVLDRRLVTRRYGAAFVRSLPESVPRTSSIERVRRWWSAS